MAERKRVGLALSGGGARGFAHIGALRALVEAGIPVDMIAGTSAGSFVGAAFASGLTPDEIAEVGKKVGWLDVARFSFSPRGLLSSATMGNFINANFPVTRFEDLKLPFAACAVDLEKGCEAVLKDEGDLAEAVRASCAIPGVFVPVEDASGRCLVDGGVISPIPTACVREMGADVVVAIDLITCGSEFWGAPSTLAGMLFQSAMIMLRTTSKHQHSRADVVIEPAIAHIRPDEMGKRDDLIRLGYEAALERADEIKALL